MYFFSIRVEMDDLSNLRLVRDFFVGVWMAILTHVVSIIIALTCQPSVHSLASNGLYFCSCVLWNLIVVCRDKW